MAAFASLVTRSGLTVGQFLQVLPQGRVDFLLVIAHPEPGGGELRFSMSPAVTGRSGGMLRPSVPSILATNSLTSAISYPALNRVVEKRSGCQSVITPFLSWRGPRPAGTARLSWRKPLAGLA